MSGIKSVFLVVVTSLLTPVRGDVEVSCGFKQSCILPCRFQAGAEVVIHWIQLTAGDAQVHSYYYNRDQVSLQNQRFKGRTKLFNNQISTGKASLQLTGVEFQDQGRYKCYTSTISGNEESFINLKVYDDEVSCVFMKSCILPCRFQAGAEVVIHWIQLTAGDAQVHSYYHNRDQLSNQNQRFRGRTKLFNNQISTGNASLQLTGVEVQDQGNYKCYTSTISGNKEYFIKLKVAAPVRTVNIEQVENIITCRSDGIYPEPELTWSTSPQSSVTIKNPTEVLQTEQQLYNISSSFTLSDNAGDLTYICTVSTQRSSRRASLKTLPPITGSGTDVTITCTASNTSLTGLIWRFNHSQIILTQTGANVPHTSSEEWSHQVKDVSKSGDLTLQDLSSKHNGIYTCELRNAEETYVGNTFLKINEVTGSSPNIAGVAAGVSVAVVAVLAAVGAGVILYLCRRKKEGNEKTSKAKGSTTEMDDGTKEAEAKSLKEDEAHDTWTGNGAKLSFMD